MTSKDTCELLWSIFLKRTVVLIIIINLVELKLILFKSIMNVSLEISKIIRFNHGMIMFNLNY